MKWLMDSYIYSFYIADNMGIIFAEIRKKSNDFANEFLQLYVKAFEMNGYFRTGLANFPTLNKLN